MELLIHYTTLPEGLELPAFELELADVLDDGGWLLASRFEDGVGIVEVELEDEMLNPKHAIVAVKSYLQRAKFAPDTAIELAGKPVGIYE